MFCVTSLKKKQKTKNKTYTASRMIPPASSGRQWFQKHEEELHKQSNVLFNLAAFYSCPKPLPFSLPPRETICLSSALFLTAQPQRDTCKNNERT